MVVSNPQHTWGPSSTKSTDLLLLLYPKNILRRRPSPLTATSCRRSQCSSSRGSMPHLFTPSPPNNTLLLLSQPLPAGCLTAALLPPLQLHPLLPATFSSIGRSICYSLEICQKRRSLFLLSSGVLHLVGADLTGRPLSLLPSKRLILLTPHPTVPCGGGFFLRRPSLMPLLLLYRCLLAPSSTPAILNRGRGALPCQTIVNLPSSSSELISYSPRPCFLPLP
ncbi:hypothetical protein BHM03_00056162 [Ensete ventricosum]|nr:hypothetical protein BHM03_00056162 [Ensete ventricosum]